jgi:hypothetical protein
MATERPEFQHQDTYQHGVDIVRVISNEFGTPLSTVRAQVAMGQILIGGLPYTGTDRFFLPYQQVKGKEINVIGPDRSWRFHYPDHDQPD